MLETYVSLLLSQGTFSGNEAAWELWRAPMTRLQSPRFKLRQHHLSSLVLYSLSTSQILVVSTLEYCYQESIHLLNSSKVLKWCMAHRTYYVSVSKIKIIFKMKSLLWIVFHFTLYKALSHMAIHNTYVQEGLSPLIPVWPVRKLRLIKAIEEQEVKKDINGHRTWALFCLV